MTDMHTQDAAGPNGAPGAEAGEPTGAEAPGPDQPGHVLLIEDEPNIATALTFILGRDGWRVTTHSSGVTALDAVARHRPDVIVLDVMLPGRSGFDVLGEIRSQPDAAIGDVPVLMLTARGQAKDRERAEALGVTRFMTKPFANRDVLDAVRALARRTR